MYKTAIFLALLATSFAQESTTDLASNKTTNANATQPEKTWKLCGSRNADGVGDKVEGLDDGYSNFGEFPWTVAILEVTKVNDSDPESPKLNLYLGSGSLIHPRAVMTVAHFLSKEKMKGLKVRAGEWDSQTTTEIYPHQDRDVEEVVLHEAFNKKQLFNDIALLFLSAPMQPAPHVGVACLPRAGDPSPLLARCIATGWGKDQFGREGRYSTVQKKIEVPIVGVDSCQETLRSTRLGLNFSLHPSFLCAGGERRDPCKGDGGAPLDCPIWFNPGRYVQRGMVSWSIGCGVEGVPGVYVDVAGFRPWLDGRLGARGLAASESRVQED